MRYLATFLLSFFASQASAVQLDLGVGTRYTNFYYAEELPITKKSTESALYATYLAQLHLWLFSGSHIQIQHEFLKDLNSKYIGSDLNTSAPVRAQNRLSFANTEALLIIPLTQRLSIYGGMGTHRWDRFLSGNPAYLEIYTWKYQPTGVQIWLSAQNNCRIGLDVSSRKTSAGKIKVITSQTVSGGVDSEMSLGARIGYRAALPMIWRVGKWTFSTIPFFELSQIGQSEVVANATLAPNPGTGIREPASTTHRYGLEMLLTFPL